MSQEITPSASDADILRETEYFARLVDQFVMVVTEGLCSMENENSRVARNPEIIVRKARILDGLDNLDRMMARYQNSTSPMA